ncbi:MAG: hypothetical protein AAF799_24090 [Myxococcota bacterium]
MTRPARFPWRPALSASLLSLAMVPSAGCFIPQLFAAGKTSEQPQPVPESGVPTGATAAAQPATPAVPPGQRLFSGDKPNPPEAYLGLTPGMTLEQAQALVPDAPKKDMGRDPDLRMTYNIKWDEDRGTIETLWFLARDLDAAALATEAWGEPIRNTGTAGEKGFLWFEPESAVRVDISDGDSYDRVEFRSYVPTEAFLGAAGEDFAFQAEHPLLGATLDEIREAYPTVLVERSATSQHLAFPPTEFELFTTRVNLYFDNKGKVRKYTFDLAYILDPTAKDSIRGMLDSKLGEPRETNKYGRTQWVYHSKKPRIVVEDNEIGKEWAVTVER